MIVINVSNAMRYSKLVIEINVSNVLGPSKMRIEVRCRRTKLGSLQIFHTSWDIEKW